MHPPSATLLRCLILPAALLALEARGALAATSYSDMVSFGDSLSDNGNAAYIFQNFPKAIPADLPAPQPPLYTSGRYTNGPDVTPSTAHQGTWVEQLSAKLSLPAPTPGLPNFLDQSLPAGNNYAVAGANTNDGSPVSIDAMVQAYLSQGLTLSPTTLYTLFGGANDVFRAAAAGLNADAAAQNAVANIFHDVQLLEAAGARNFLIPNLPDLGTTPRAVETGEVAELSAASQIYATAWTAAVTAAKSSGDNVIGVDLYGLYAAIEADPAAYGILNVTTPAQGLNVDVDAYLFWDILHPTTAGHGLIADAAFNALNPTVGAPTPTPEPVSLMLSTFGFAIVFLVGVYRRVSSQIPVAVTCQIGMRSRAI